MKCTLSKAILLRTLASMTMMEECLATQHAFKFWCWRHLYKSWYKGLVFKSKSPESKSRLPSLVRTLNCMTGNWEGLCSISQRFITRWLCKIIMSASPICKLHLHWSSNLILHHPRTTTSSADTVQFNHFIQLSLCRDSRKEYSLCASEK